MRTGLEHLEALLDKVANTGFVAVPLIREAMLKDYHEAYHDATWEKAARYAIRNELKSNAFLLGM